MTTQFAVSLPVGGGVGIASTFGGAVDGGRHRRALAIEAGLVVDDVALAIGRVGRRSGSGSPSTSARCSARSPRPGGPEPLSTSTATCGRGLHRGRRGRGGGRAGRRARRGGVGGPAGRGRAAPAVADRSARAVVDHLEQHDADDDGEPDERGARAAENATLRPKPTPLPVRDPSTRRPPGRMVESLMVGKLRWEIDPCPSTLSARGSTPVAHRESRRSGSNR